MPLQRLSFPTFNRRLVVAGGREQAGPQALRRAQNVAPELTNSVWSRWGSSDLYTINAKQLFYWDPYVYSYDGTTLYQNGSVIKTGFNGGYLRFNSMPPQSGLDDYLFILGGGVTPFKIDPSGNVTNWGIAPPSMPPTLGSRANSVLSWTGAGWTATLTACTQATGAGSPFGTMTAISPTNSTAGWWGIIWAAPSPLDWGSLYSGLLSLPSDVIQLYLLINGAPSTFELLLRFDVNDGTFTQDFYQATVVFYAPGSQIPSPTAGQLNLPYTEASQLVTLAKSSFRRVGANLQYDWTNIKAVQIAGTNFTGNVEVSPLELRGGYPLGAGPAVGNGGLTYQYFVTFVNGKTGSESNPTTVGAPPSQQEAYPLTVPAVELEFVELANIPVSTDPQVTERNLYRTQGLPSGVPIGQAAGQAFLLDTVPDNTTTDYQDITADLPILITLTPWMPSVAVPPNTSAAEYVVDGLNGYFFKLITAGTTGSQPPNWIVPSTQWTGQTGFDAGETVAPRKASGTFFRVTTAGISGQVEPNWVSALTPGATITDGTVVWTSLGAQNTTDNTAVWEFQGINSTPVLGPETLLLDNAPPAITYQDAYGPFQGSMFWCDDSAPNVAGYVYASPPGRPESVGQAYLVGGNDDPTQKLIEWDGQLWLFCQARVYRLAGTYPQISPDGVNFAVGTNAPLCIVPVQLIGIVYWAPDGIRIMNWSGSLLYGFEQISPLLRGQAEEDMPPWSPTNGPVWATLSRDEIIFSDSSGLTLAISYDGLWGGAPAWRRIAPVLTAAYYAKNIGQVLAAFGGSVYYFEQPGQMTDQGTPIAFEIQTGGEYPDPGAQFTTQRLYITGTLNGQSLTPVLTVDGNDNTLPAITGTARQTFELEPKVPGRFFDGVRLTGALTERIEVIRVEADIWLGERQV